MLRRFVHRFLRPLLRLSAAGLAAALLLPAAAASAGEDWPHWRGPTRDGVSSETGLPVEWDSEKGVVWKTPMPAWSGATPIISGETIFLNVSIPAEDAAVPANPSAGRRRRGGGGGAGNAAYTGRLELWALDRTNGEVRWRRPLGEREDRRGRKQNMSSPSPVTDGERVFALTGTGILKAFDFAGGELWSRDIQADYGDFGLNWGYASSPLLFRDALFVQVLHGMKTDDPSYLLRLSPDTGETVWRVERPTEAIRESPDSYSTPFVHEVDGRWELVITGGDVVTGHDLDTGFERWRSRGLNPENNASYRIVSSPVVKDGIIYAPTRVKPLLALRTGGEGDITDTHRIWAFDRGPDVPSPVTDGERFYVVTDNGVLYALDARSGEVLWGPERLPPGTYSASPVLAEGRLYVINEDGVASVARVGEEFELLAENDMGAYTLSSLAFSDGQIFLRTAEALYCIGAGGD